MDIKEFIKTTLKDLSEAIAESNQELKKHVILTNTSLRSKGAGNYGLINFDLAVEAKSSQSSGKGAGIKIAVVEAKIGKDDERESSSISRIQFTVEANFGN